jgi:phosphatidylserine/phosphatidylglycerophosphate/cardiolipin synthase-like enzyme
MLPRTYLSTVPGFIGLILAGVLIPFCSGTRAEPVADFRPGSVTFVESVPVETVLDLPDLPDAAGVWLQLVENARRSLDIFAFYVSPNPDGICHLQPILAMIENRARDGVKVRLLSERKFHALYPETHDRFQRMEGIEARLLDGEAFWGGVLHAKGMIIDGKRFFLGSQNWDWRALEHIHELGVVVAHEGLAANLTRIYELDWALAGGEIPSAKRRDVPTSPEWLPVHHLTLPDGRLCEAVLAASPPEALPPDVPWDLPLLIDQIDRARHLVRLQFLSYHPAEHDGKWWPELEGALRSAAVRGCDVQIILSNWQKRPSRLPHIQSLAVLPRIEIRFVNIPPWTGGFIPYARTVHAKYMICDDAALWLGTSNGARNDFYQSRNVSIFLRGEGCSEAAEAFFTRSWNSPYAETVDPCGQYIAPARE